MFFSNVNFTLNVIAIVIASVAILWAGFQIAFKQKMIKDVSNVLISSFLISATCLIARIFL